MHRGRVGKGRGGQLRSGRGASASARAGRAATALACLVAFGFVGAAGCGEGPQGSPDLDTGAPGETLAEARQADSAALTCVDLKRGGGFKAHDTQISKEKAGTSFGSSAFALSGASSSGPADPLYALFEFPTSSIPASATVVSATLTLSQINNGAATAKAHLITAPWDEGTVTWSSFADAFNPVAFKSFSTASGTLVLNVAPQVQAWVNGSVPNHGLLIEQPGALQTKYRTQEYLVPAQRPVLHVCYTLSCASGFADCNGVAADGCEADLASPAHCGGCATACALPHAGAACVGGACAVGACDLGFGDCDGNAGNGCERDLSSAGDCGACGVPCALPHAASSCAGGSCKLLSCDAGAFDCDGDPSNGCEPTPCADGAHCGAGVDCESGVCLGGFCVAPACNDHAKNGGETDTDCGGGCPPCAVGLACALAGDCQGGVCAGGACAAPSCDDAVKNGGEADVDCGGACAPCADGAHCGAGTDCGSGVCLGNSCQAPSCNDGLTNGSETSVDCGGACAPCAGGAGCLGGSDCQSGVCGAGVCQLPSCADHVKNGSEADVDCGGSCVPCSSSATCSSAADCQSGVCGGGHCQPASCTDHVKNGDESGVDCGGACTVPEVCNGVDDDCNGSVDEGLGSSTCGLGACQRTVQNCVGGQPKACVPGTPVPEICDGALDDDCDGVVDNGCECVNGATQGCYTGAAATVNVGACHAGTQTCALGHWGACAGEITPTAEICNGVDDDCDTETDEGLGSTICGVGACQVMVQNCVAGVAQSCTPGAPGAESCDGLDNNCNGAVDDGNPGGGASCNLANPCHVGATACISAALACTDTGATLAAGSACGQNQVCSPAGACVACTQGQACTPAAACMQGAIACGSGAPICQATAPVADGTACAGGTCTSGICSANGTISGTKNLSTDSLTAGRSCAEAVSYSVIALTAGSATLSAAVTAGCLSPGDLVLLINEQGVAGATVNVGNYEILTVDTVSGSLVTWKTAKTAFYGSAAGGDANIGTGAAQQKVVLQRLPVFGNLSVPAGAVLTVSPWDGLTGGVLAFRAAAVTVAGSITAAGKGYRSGGYNIDDGSCSDNLTTENGESIGGPPTQTTAANGGGSGGLAGGSGISYNGNTPLSASAGHATAGQAGQNPNGRTLGPAGAAYGSGNGTNLTLGSGCGGNLTCQGGSFAPFIGARASAAGGIVAVFASSITVSAGGSVNASGLNGTRTAASGGYVLLRANTLNLGSSLVQAIGATGISSGNTGSFNNVAGDGYITLDYKTSLSGTTLPAATATQKPGLVLP